MSGLVGKIRKFLDTRTLKVDGAVFLLSKILGMVIVFTMSWWITDSFGAELWGMYVLFLAVISPVSFLCLVGADTLAVKYIARGDLPEFQKRKIIRSLLKTVLLILLPTCFLITFAFALYFESNPTSGSSKSYFTACLIGLSVIVATLYSFSLGVLRGLRNIIGFGFYQNVWPMAMYLSLVVIFTIVGLKVEINSLIFLHFVVYSVALISLYLVIERHKSEREVSEAAAPEGSFGVSDAFREGIPIMLISMMGIILTYTDVVVIYFFYGSKEVGIYDISVKFSSIAALALVAANAYVMPKVSELLSKGENKELSRFIDSCTKIVFWVSFPIAFVGFLFAPFIMTIYGDEFIGGTEALRILLLAQFFSAMCGSVSVVLQMSGYQNNLQWIFAVAVVANIILNLILIPELGLTGAAISTLFSTILWNSMASFVAFKRLGIRTIHYPFKG